MSNPAIGSKHPSYAHAISELPQAMGVSLDYDFYIWSKPLVYGSCIEMLSSRSFYSDRNATFVKSMFQLYQSFSLAACPRGAAPIFGMGRVVRFVQNRWEFLGVVGVRCMMGENVWKMMGENVWKLKDFLYVAIFSLLDKTHFHTKISMCAPPPCSEILATPLVILFWPNLLIFSFFCQVRNSKGEEGYVPAISCILPTPDNSALTAVERCGP